MNERERLVNLLSKAFNVSDDNYGTPNSEQVADYLLKNGVIVPPCERVYFIVNKGTQHEYVDSMGIHSLQIYEVNNLSKYGFYTTKKSAEKALKGGEGDG